MPKKKTFDKLQMTRYSFSIIKSYLVQNTIFYYIFLKVKTLSFFVKKKIHTYKTCEWIVKFLSLVLLQIIQKLNQSCQSLLNSAMYIWLHKRVNSLGRASETVQNRGKQRNQFIRTGIYTSRTSPLLFTTSYLPLKFCKDTPKKLQNLLGISEKINKCRNAEPTGQY